MFDLDDLAEKTEGYSSADIKSLCEEIKLKMLQQAIQNKDVKITKDEINEMIAKRKPSITKEMLAMYEAFTKEYGERK